MPAKLYLTPTPIGNYEDITLRALRLLKESDFIICEEYKEARRLLSHYGITKELVSMNEHNEKESVPELISKIESANIVTLISDCGSPIFSDPGKHLLEMCLCTKIEIIPLPGANSLITALIGGGLSLDKFYYRGWLSPKKEIRAQELTQLKKVRELLVLMDTPYRLIRLLEDVQRSFGNEIYCVLAFELTGEREKFFRGSVREILAKAQAVQLKGEFVLMVDNSI